jgi:hypothetical protein
MTSPPPLNTSTIALFGYHRAQVYSPNSPPLANDSFNTWDGNTWALSGSNPGAVWYAGYIRFVPANFHSYGQCEYKPGVSPQVKKWRTIFTVGVAGGNTAGGPESNNFGVAFYADAVTNDVPLNGWAVKVTNIYASWAGVQLCKNGSIVYQMAWNYASLGSYIVEIDYVNGQLRVLLNSVQIFKHFIGEGSYSKFYYFGENVGPNPYNNNNHNIDLLDAKIETLGNVDNTSITLNDTLAAYQTYTQYGNYIDGTVRVWDSGNIGADSPYKTNDDECHYKCYTTADSETWEVAQTISEFGPSTGDTYFDVHVRVRADGWILAWMLRTEDRTRFLWWGDIDLQWLPKNLADPLTFTNRLERAIEIIPNAAGLANANFWISDVSYYDYEFTDAARLWIFGKSQTGQYSVVNDTYSYYYLTIPNGVVVKKAFFYWMYRGVTYAFPNRGNCWCRGYVEGVQKYDYTYTLAYCWSYFWITGGGGSHPAAVDITSILTTGVQHTFCLRSGAAVAGTAQEVYNHKQVVFLETS